MVINTEGQKKAITAFSSLLATFVVMVGIGFAMIYGVHLVPFEKIKDNVEKSAEKLHQEGYYDIFYYDFHWPIGEYMQYALDGWTDAIMIMEAANLEENSDALTTAMLNKRISLKDNQTPYDIVADYPHYREENGTYVYGRYWHGYLVTLIPALTIMDLTQIRCLNFILFSLLIVAISYYSYKRLNLATAAQFLLTLLMGVFLVVPYSMQFSSVFYVSFSATLCLLLFKKIWQRPIWSFVFFFIVGALTSYVDLLTAPLITLGFPLIYYGLLKNEDVSLKDIILQCVMWSLGYLMMWSAKWGIAYLITGFDMIGNAVEEVNVRLGTNDDTSVFKVFGRVIMRMPTQMKYLFMMALAYWIGASKQREQVRKNLWLVFVALIPIVWLCLLKNHTYAHLFMTWRNLYISVFAVLMFVYRTTNGNCISSIGNSKNMNYE